MTELAFDIVFEILARVPVKDLLRFRCVCKSWRSLFQDDRFIRKHTTHAPSMLLLVVCWPHDTPRICTYEGRRLKMISQEPELYNDREKSLLFITSVIGHCDGLFCLMLQDNFLAVWNPALRELRKVLRVSQQQTWRMIGFGYDHSTQDHKIVLIPLTNFAIVLTLKSSVSRMIDFPWRKIFGLIRVKTDGILVGEYIFWPLYARESTTIENGANILSFSEGQRHSTTALVLAENTCIEFKGVERKSMCGGERERGNYCDDMVVWCADHEKEDKGRIKSWSKILRLTASDIERSTRWRVDEFR